MNNQIIVTLDQGVTKQKVFIYLKDNEMTCQNVDMENLFSVVTMSAAKYKIKNIKIVGPKEYSKGIKDQLTKKINTCFGEENDFTVELVSLKEIKG